MKNKTLFIILGIIGGLLILYFVITLLLSVLVVNNSIDSAKKNLLISEAKSVSLEIKKYLYSQSPTVTVEKCKNGKIKNFGLDKNIENYLSSHINIDFKKSYICFADEDVIVEGQKVFSDNVFVYLKTKADSPYKANIVYGTNNKFYIK